MAATWEGYFAAVVAMVMAAVSARGDEPRPRRAVEAAAGPEKASGIMGPPKPDATEAKPPPTGVSTEAPTASNDAPTVRSETVERLKQMGDPTAKDSPAGAKKLKELLEERLQLLDAWQKASKALHEAEHPKQDPDQQFAKSRAEIERLKPLLDQSARDPESLLPSPFRPAAKSMPESILPEMKEAIEAARIELKDGTAQLEKLRAEAGSPPGNPLASLRAERDKLHQRVASLKTRRLEREAALTSAATPEARETARERLVNFEWEHRIEEMRLQTQEARLALQPKLMELARLNLQAAEAQVLVVKRTLERMQARYRVLAEREELDQETKAAREQKRAAKAEDPLERYRARRTAELHELHAQVLKDEKSLTTSPPPTLEEQKALADRADETLAAVKGLIEDGQVSRLDALRLNNDFRRIGLERARIIRHELAAVTRRLSYYEGALSNAEFDLINEARNDRFERDSLLEHLQQTPPAEVLAMFDDLEAKHRALLERRHTALVKLAERTEWTQDQILRRLRTLDDQYGFIRTQIFWVRDQEPVGAAITSQARREVLLVNKSLVRLASEACDRTLRGRVSVEFAVACLAIVALPWPLLRIQRANRRRAG